VWLHSALDTVDRMTRRLQVASDVVSRRVDEEMVLVHLGRDRIYSLNVTAARYWELLGDGLEHATILQRLQDEFDVDETVLCDEVDRLVTDLTREGLVVEDADG
jgi:hypothetical protein